MERKSWKMMSPMEVTLKAMMMMIPVRRTRTLILTKIKAIFYASIGVSEAKLCLVLDTHIYQVTVILDRSPCSMPSV